MKYLKGRKYLDALCVYFWATTPVLISILTFATYVLLGNKLTAATVFTSIALLNMLIGPLNAFPWVLNGVTEAWVSIKRIQALLNVRLFFCILFIMCIFLSRLAYMDICLLKRVNYTYNLHYMDSKASLMRSDFRVCIFLPLCSG